MNVGLYQAASALNANARWQDLIAENLASSSIPGFKKQELSFAAVQAGQLPVPSQGAQHFALPIATVATNFAQGEVRCTGGKTDLALEGRGFFSVQLPDGNTGYTRDGEFHLNSSGQLVTKQGYLVLGDGGPIQIDQNNPAELSISPTGDVSQGIDVKGRIKVVDFEDLSLLAPSGNGYFTAQHPHLQPREAPQTTVRQHFLEASNSSPITEMTQLISAMRLYEANQRVVQMSDERLGRAISELGNPS